MQGITIDLNEIKEHAIRVDQSNSSFLETLNDFSSVMQSLVQHWESPSANTLYEEFRKLLPMFDKYFDYIEGYHQFLNKTAQTYELLDKSIENGIEVA